MRKADQQKSIFVTGAASGIGRATALLFAERGWFVELFDVNEKELRAVAEAIGESCCRYQALDVTDPLNYEHAIKYFGKYTGQTMDVLFNCAGITSHGPFEAVALSDLLRIVNINVNDTIIGIHLSMELLRNTPGSRIIVCEVAFAEWTDDEQLRQTTFLGWRDDKNAELVTRNPQRATCNVLPPRPSCPDESRNVTVPAG
jgi:NAD(P)-dependent dehydrogenase (short-subunit alcohol dehydrogenase family)